MNADIRAGARRHLLSVAGSALHVVALLAPGIGQAIPVATADSVGEIVVEPVAGKTIVDVNRKFGTTLQLQVTDTPQAMVRSNAVTATLAAMQADMAAPASVRTVLWAEPNTNAD